MGLMSDLVDDPTGKFLKVKLITKKGLSSVSGPYLFDEGADITWMPNGDKLTTEAPGVKIEKLEELIYVESLLCNTGSKFYGEWTEQIVKNKDAPGSDNGTGLFQTLCSFKIREAYEKIVAAKA